MSYGEIKVLALKSRREMLMLMVLPAPKTSGNPFGNVPRGPALFSQKEEFKSQQVQQSEAGKGREKGLFWERT